MSISAISGGLPAGVGAHSAPKRVCASLQEICLNTIRARRDLTDALKGDWLSRKLGKSAVRMILTSFEPYKNLPSQWRLSSIEWEFARMDLPLSHPNEERISVHARHRFRRFKEDVLELFSCAANRVPVDKIENIEDPTLFLQEVVKLTQSHPMLTAWPHGPKSAKNVLLREAETTNCWEAINALVEAGAESMLSDEESEDEEADALIQGEFQAIQFNEDGEILALAGFEQV